MENLNKQQLVLLTILVSFVTSIGTGITTVSLLDETAPNITQTINRVVEKTIEKVTPGPTVVKEVPKEVTVVVRQEDETIKALEKNAKSIVRIKGTGPKGEEFLGIGIVVSKEGLVLADKNTLPDGYTLSGIFADGVHLLTGVRVDSVENFVLLKTEPLTTPMIPVTLANSDVVRLGQSIVGVSGPDKNAVSIGIVSGVGERDIPGDTTIPPKKQTYSFDTSFSLSNIISGSPIIDLNGNVIGIKIGNGSGTDIFKASNLIKTFLTAKP